MFMTLRISIFCFLFFLFSNCSNNKEEKKIKEHIKVGQMEYDILKRSFGTSVSKDGSQLDSSKGYFFQINLIVRNHGNSTINFDTSYFNLVDNEGNVLPYSKTSSVFMQNFEPSLYSVEITPGAEKSGFIMFDVPRITNYKLQLSNGDWSEGKIDIEIQK